MSKRSLSAVAVFVGLASGLSAQGPASPQDTRQTPTFVSSTNLVALNVTVTDGGRLVSGLSREQFRVFEDGVEQEVRFFESTSVPLDLILLLDTSSSMRDRMPAVHDAARAFMKILRPGDRGAVVSFNEHVRVQQALTDDWAALEAAIGAATARGSTALHNAIYVALKEFGMGAVSDQQVRRQAIAVLSDGDDTSSLVTFEDVVALARITGVNVYTIGLQSAPAGSRGSSPARAPVSSASYTLNQLARETGARAFFPAGAHELKDVYGAIAAELGAQYSIAYSPTNGSADGRFRRVLVRIPEKPAFQPRTRTGYTAEGPRTNSDGEFR